MDDLLIAVTDALMVSRTHDTGIAPE